MNSATRTLGFCLKKKESMKYNYLVYYNIFKKFQEVCAIENLVKITKYVKLIKYFLLEDHQREILKLCPRNSVQKNESKIIKSLEQNQQETLNILFQEKDKVDLKIVNYLKFPNKV